VVPAYEPGVPDWVAAGGFFVRPRYPSGATVRRMGTGNLLVGRGWLERVEGPFDRRFDLTGGSDTHLLERLHRLGARMVWCDEALSYEHIPASRGNARWLLRRAYRTGIMASCIETMLDPAVGARVSRVARGMGGVGKGIGQLVPALARGRGPLLFPMRSCVYNMGRVVGTLGVRYEEYRQPHGR
jgi:hypothetical protein